MYYVLCTIYIRGKVLLKRVFKLIFVLFFFSHYVLPIVRQQHILGLFFFPHTMLISVLLVSTFLGLAVAGPFPQVPGQAPPESPTFVVETPAQISEAPEAPAQVSEVPELWEGDTIPPDERNAKGWPLLSDDIPLVFVDPKCSNEQRYTLFSAWQDAKNLSVAQSTPKEDYNFDIPHKDWLGPEWDGEAWHHSNNDAGESMVRKMRKVRIYWNIYRNGVFYKGRRQQPHVIYWTCEDVEKKCEPHQISGKTYNDYEGVNAYKNRHTTIWCPDFFNLELLEDQIQRHRGDERAMSLIDNFAINAGTVMFHEIYKYESQISYPGCKPKGFIQGDDRAEKIWKIARLSGGGTKTAYITADCYVMDAVAIFVQQSYGTGHPPIPRAINDILQPPPNYDPVDPDGPPPYTSIQPNPNSPALETPAPSP
jgi:hypothetical protein